MNKNKRSTAYSETQAVTYDFDRFHSEAGRLIHIRELELLNTASELSKVKSMNVLEVGCGTGRFLVEMASKGHDVTGIDPSESMLEIAACKLRSRSLSAGLMKGEAASISYPNETFDFVYAIRVLNQIESEDYALQSIIEMHRVSKQNGYILIEFLNALRPKFIRRGPDNVRLSPSHVIATLMNIGAKIVWMRGAFLLGMTSYNFAPKGTTMVIDKVDRLLSYVVPNLCSRCYVLAKKGSLT